MTSHFMDVNFCHLVNSGADLSEADLRGADFSLANVTKVHIQCYIDFFMYVTKCV